MQIHIFVSILLFGNVLCGQVAEKQRVQNRPEHASVGAVHEGGKTARGKREVRPAKSSLINRAAKGAVRVAGWLLHADQSTPDLQDESRKTTARQAKRR